MHQVILNIIVTKYLDNKIFDHIDPWGETLESIAWAIIYFYHCNIMFTPVQALFGKYIIFNLVSVVSLRVIITAK